MKKKRKENYQIEVDQMKNVRAYMCEKGVKYALTRRRAAFAVVSAEQFA